MKALNEGITLGAEQDQDKEQDQEKGEDHDQGQDECGGGK